MQLRLGLREDLTGSQPSAKTQSFVRKQAKPLIKPISQGVLIFQLYFGIDY